MKDIYGVTDQKLSWVRIVLELCSLLEPVLGKDLD